MVQGRMNMKLYGSPVSPFARRIRFLLSELNLQYEWINTTEEENQTTLRSKNPIWKIPYMENEDVRLWDSHAILEYLTERYGRAGLRSPNSGERWKESNLLYA